MRDILTGLALLLIAVLTAALAGPYFIDWTQRRALFEEHIGALIGAPVAIKGAIDVTLLPTPHFRLANVSTGAPEGPSLNAEELDLEIAVMPLLRGDVRVTDARLVAPRLEFALMPDGGVEGLALVLGRIEGLTGVAIERLRIIDGVVAVTDRLTGHVVSLMDIDADADAQSLTGPWRASGRALLNDVPLELRLATGAPEPAGTRLKIVAETMDDHQRGEFDGRFFATGQAKEQVNGRLLVGGRMRWPDRDGFTTRPWTFVSNLRIAGRSGVLDGAELEAGGDEAPVKFSGAGQLSLGAQPGLALTLEARQIDLDRPFSNPQNPATPAFGAVAGGWLAALGQTDAGLPLPMPLTISVKVNNVILGGDTLSGLAGEFATSEDGRFRVSKTTANLPGQASIDVAGDVRIAGGGQFNGRVQIRARDVARLMGWLEGEPGGRSTRVSDARDFSAQADVSVTPSILAARNMRVTIDRSSVQGAMRFTSAEAIARGRFEAQLTSDGLSIEQVPDVSTLMAAGRGLDVALTLDAKNVRVGQTTGPDVGAGRVSLRLGVNAEGVQIDTLDIADVGGASVKASGRVGDKGGRVEAVIDARKVEPLAELLRKVAPGPLPALLVSRAAALGPLKVKLTAERGETALSETRLVLEGTAAASRLDGLARIGGERASTGFSPA